MAYLQIILGEWLLGNGLQGLDFSDPAHMEAISARSKDKNFGAGPTRERN